MKMLDVTRVAHERGTSIQEIADKLGISRRALSSRIKCKSDTKQLNRDCRGNWM